MAEHPHSIVIIADDVTGAADSAARCQHAGLAAAIDLASPDSWTEVKSAIHPKGWSAPETGEALAISTDSRFLSPQQAATRISSIIAPLTTIVQTAQTHWYKKIDSTLRGNIGSEIEAMLPLVTPLGIQPCAVICPAFPAQGRTLVNGYLSYTGLPSRTVHLPTLLAEQSHLPVATIALSSIHAGFEALCEVLQTNYQAGSVLFAADAETEDDLRRLLSATVEILPHALLCGSAGLVGVLAQELAQLLPTTALRADHTAPLIQYPVLAVVGSGSIMAHQQIEYLVKHTDAIPLEVDPAKTGNRETEPDILAQQFVQQLQSLHTTENIVLHLPTPPAGSKLEGEEARHYAIILATVARAITNALKPATLLLVGGDTAVHTLAMLNIQRLWVQTELLPGMPLTIGQNGVGKEYQIILKAGNHGDETTLAYLYQLPLQAP